MGISEEAGVGMMPFLVIPSEARDLVVRRSRRRQAPHPLERILARSLRSLGMTFLFLLLPFAVRAQTHMLIVSGLGGDPKYTSSFKQWGTELADAARTRYGLPDSEVVYLAEDTNGEKIAGKSTKDEIESTLTKFRARAGAGDQLVIVLIGHGSPGEGGASKISLPGPDMTASDFARVLTPWSSQRVAFINLPSASGDFLPEIAAQNRVVITATKSGFERNESVFAGFFIAALSKDGADVDKDNRVSLLEAFRYAAAETKRHYEDASKIQTEHAQLDDAGDKRGTPEPDARTQGALANRFYLNAGSAVARANGGAGDAQLAALYRDKQGIEDRLDALRKRKGTMSATAYDDALELVLVDLARKSLTIRQLEGRGGGTR